MKRRDVSMILSLVLAMVLIWTMPSEGVAQSEPASGLVNQIYTDKWTVVPDTHAVPHVDGVLDEPAWQEAAVLDGFVTAYFNEAADPDQKVKLLYDDQHVYIGFEYTGEDHGVSLANLEVLLSPSADGNRYYRIPVEIKSLHPSYVNDWGPSLTVPDHIQSQVAFNENGLTVEIAVPLASLGVNEVTLGEEWRFNVIAQPELGTQPLNSWIPIRTSYFDDLGTRDIIVKANVSDEGRAGSIFMGALPDEQWMPEELSVQYDSFTEKTLRYQTAHVDFDPTTIQLEWKAPFGDWQAIHNPQITEEEGALAITFQHPDPDVNGLYQLQIQMMDNGQTEGKRSIITFDRHSLIRAGDSLFIQEQSNVNKAPVSPAAPTDEVNQLLHLIPEKTGFLFVGQPDLPELRPSNVFQWSPNNPGTLTSRHSDFTFPNEQYPEDQVIIVKNSKGEEVEYPYYEDENGKRYFFSAHIWYQQKDYVLGKIVDVANRDPLGAARLLYRFAEVYEGYVPTQDYLWHNYPYDANAGPPFPYYGGKWYRWSLAELGGSFRNLVKAYDIVKDTTAFDVLSDEIGEDVEHKIVEDMLKPSVEFVRTHAVINTNMDYNNWLGLTDVGKALRDPSYIHDAFDRIDDYVKNTFLFDGFFQQTTISYHVQSTDGINLAIDNIAGWSDPEGYRSPRSGTSFFDLDMRKDIPVLDNARKISNLLVYPNGKWLPTQDTWAFRTANNPDYHKGSILMPASGFSRLARGAASGLVDGEIPGWTPSHSVAGKIRVVESNPFAGRRSLHIDDDDGRAYGLESDLVEILPGTPYTASVKTYQESGGSPVIFFNYYNEDKERIQLHVGSGGTEGEWDDITLTKQAPADAAYASITLFSDSIGNRSLYFDDVAIRDGNGVNVPILNAGFELSVGEDREYFGLIYDFPALDITQQSIGHVIYADSGTVQLEANSEGHSIAFHFDVAKQDTYEIHLKPYRAGTYGRYDVEIDGEKVTTVNFYGIPGGSRDFETLTTMELSPGTHEIAFINDGKDDNATNYKMGIIQLALLDEEAQQERDEAVNAPPIEDGDPTQVYLTYTPKYGHHHFDPLSLTLFDEGQELLPDIGYTHTIYAQWSRSTLSHNTVVVDGADMNISGSASHGGNVDVFAPHDSGIQVTRVNQETAYPQTDMYNREPWLIQFPDASNNEGYVLDLFRVSGGDRHEYTLQGDANYDAYFDTNLNVSEYGPYLLPQGVDVREPETELDQGDAEGHYYGYIYVRDVEKADISDGHYQLTLVTEQDGQEMAKMNIHGIVDPGQNELFLGESPSLRATRLIGTSGDTNVQAEKYTMPKMVLRREGSDLTSHFITAMEPYRNGSGPRIEQVENITPDYAAEGDIAVSVTYGNTTDIVLSSLNPEEPFIVGDMVLNGKMGMIRLIDGEVESMYVIGGTLLRKGNLEVTANGPITGTITEVRRIAAGDGHNAFVTHSPVSMDNVGKTIVVTRPDGKTFGYVIKDVIAEGAKTIIEIEDYDPGFTIHSNGTTKLDYYPFTEWNGETSLRIENAAHEFSPRPLIYASSLQDTLHQYEEELYTEQAYRALNLHLTSVSQFEKLGQDQKVIQHMESFIVLLDHFQAEGLMNERLHTLLSMDAATMIHQRK